MSLRARLVAGLTVVAVVLVVVSVVVARTTEANLVAQVDDRLERAAGPEGAFDDPEQQSRGGPFGGGAGASGPPDLGPAPFEPAPESSDTISALFVGVVDAEGETERLIDPGLSGDAGAQPSFDGVDLEPHLEDRAPFTVVSDDGSTRYRAVASAALADDATLVVAIPLTEVDTTVDRLILLELLAVVVVSAVLGLVAWWVLHLGVRPIQAMTETATAIADGDLSQRVPAGKPGTEAAELGTALNQMLGSIEVAFDERAASEERVRRFVADASHELRTPVATVRGYAELYRAGGLPAGPELDEAMRRTEQEAVRMGTLVDDLLALARLDQGRPVEQEPVDLRAVVLDVVADARVRAPDRPIDADVDDEALVVTGDDGRLHQVLHNLVGNALVHTEPGTSVEVVARSEDGQVVVSVVDHGDGMAPEVAAHAFERFYRADPSRARHKGGNGLGLAIVSAVVAAHGGEVTLAETPGGGATATVRLPAAS